MKLFNFRLFLRPTAVGKIIINRLTSEGVDRQADARRWMELGYMCEQAGFRLDGSTLFQAGRPAAAEQFALAQVAVQSTAVAAPTTPAAGSPAVQQAEPVAPANAESRSVANTSSGLPPSPPVAPSPIAQGEASTAMGSQLASNLRNLAH